MTGDGPLNAAVVGLGWWGRHIVRQMKESGKLRVDAACDPDPAAADFAREHGVPLVSDLAELLSGDAVDAVILTTPNALHRDQTVAAAQAGKHVFCEKPLALTGKDAAEAQAACDAAGVVLGIGHERRFEPAWAEIARMIAAGELGTVMHAEGNFNHDKLVGVDPGNWRASPTEAPAAGMTAMGIHLIDAYVHFFGRAEAAYAMTARRTLAWETGDTASALLRFEAGMTGYINAILDTPHHCRMLVYGSEAWAEALNATHPDTPGPTRLTVRRKGAESETTVFDWRDTVRANLEAFADACAGRADYPYTAFEKVHTVEVLEAVARSAETGDAVAVGG